MTEYLFNVTVFCNANPGGESYGWANLPADLDGLRNVAEAVFFEGATRVTVEPVGYAPCEGFEANYEPHMNPYEVAENLVTSIGAALT